MYSRNKVWSGVRVWSIGCLHDYNDVWSQYVLRSPHWYLVGVVLVQRLMTQAKAMGARGNQGKISSNQSMGACREKGGGAIRPGECCLGT